MKVLVLGGSGLFGRKTIHYLLEDSRVSCVVSMDLTPPSDLFVKSIGKHMEKFHFIQGDVSSLEDILNALKQYSVEKIVNWGFFMGKTITPDPRLSAKVNVLGMSNVFEAAKLMGISRVVYASSVAVYGSQADYGDREVTENDRLFPSHPYALAKNLAELMADQYNQQHGMSLIGLRPTLVFGHGGQTPIVVKWLSETVSFPAVGKTISLNVDGKRIFSVVSADDIANFTRILLHAPSPPHTIYNLSGPPCSLRDVAEAVRKYLPDAIIAFGDQAMIGPGSGDRLPTKISCARANSDFGFSVMPLDEAVFIHINDARLEAGLEPIKPASHN